MTWSRSPSPATPRGFTLLELLVGTVVTSIILAAVAVSIMGVQASYQTESRITAAVEGLRTGTNFLEQRLRLAGYGVDPRFAFDFDTTLLPSGNKANHVVTLAAGVPTAITDDLAFRYRDPSWMRRGVWSSGIKLESGTFGMAFPEGQRFIISCEGGKNSLVVRAGAGGVAKDATSSANFTVDPRLSTIPADEGCLTKEGRAAPFVLLLHEVRIRVVALEGRPFLMAFQGLDTLDLANAVPLMADVESFQVAYVMNRPPPTGFNANLDPVDKSSPVSNWVLGDVGSALTDRFPDPNTRPEPVYRLTYDDPARFNRHPANIRAVRLSIGVRSTSPEPNGRRAFPRLNLEDSGEAKPADGYYRTNMSTTVRVPNLLSRSAFNPPVDDSVSGLNAWGG
jgi:type IV pilus assembly protein PilW